MGGHHDNMPVWLKNIPDNYTAQLAIMGWFLTLTSKMTGYTIPGVGVAPGGIIEQQTDAIAHYLMDMETLADAMAVKKSSASPKSLSCMPSCRSWQHRSAMQQRPSPAMQRSHLLVTVHSLRLQLGAHRLLTAPPADCSASSSEPPRWWLD